MIYRKICTEDEINLFMEKPTQFINTLSQKGYPIVRTGIGGEEYAFVFEPKYVKKILECRETGRTNFSKLFEPIAGGSLILNDGDIWKKQRKMVASFFNLSQININEIENIAKKALTEWNHACTNNMPVDAVEAIKIYCMNVLSFIIYGKNESREKLEEINQNWVIALEAVTQKMSETSECMETNSKMQMACNRIEEIMYSIIDEKIKGGATGEDFLSYLIRQGGEEISQDSVKRQIMREIKGLYIAGFETIAGALSWFISELARDSYYQDTCRGEMEAMQYSQDVGMVRNCFYESIRLHPPLVFIDRRLFVDISFEEGDFLEMGTDVLICPYALHRDPMYWEDAATYKPERFEGKVEKDFSFSFLPYGGGQMKCMGEQLSIVERNVLFKMILRDFKFSLDESVPVVEDNKLVHKPKSVIINLSRNE